MVTRRVSVGVDADVSPFVRSMTGASAAARGFARELESADSRMANLVQTGLALAPALVPLGASAVPAIAGLTTQLGFAVAAAGTAVLAFQGVGDALDALNEYHIDPSSKNFEKLREELDKLGPAGQEFTLYLQSLRPQMQELQDIAQQGMLPGVEDGLRDLMTLMPEFSGIIERISTTMGTLAAEAGADLASDRWRPFFDFLDREAAPTLTAMGQTLGNVVEGMANMVMAFNPLADDFSTGMVRMSRSFADWAANLSGSEGFQGFVDYVRESGPAALDALGGIAEAFISLLEAAAPVGQVVLPMIEALAEGISAIAESPAGPALVSLGAAVGVLGRSMALLQTVGLRGGDSMLGRMFGGAVKPIKEATGALTTVIDASERATMSAKDHERAERSRAESVRAGAARLGQAGALVGAFALSQSGLAESAGIANTATLGLVGTLAGPWGAAIGAGVGLTMDLAAANNDLEAAQRAAGAAARSSSVDFVAHAATVRSLQAESQAYLDAARNPLGSLGNFMAGLSDTFTNAAAEGAEAAQEATVNLAALRQGAADFYAALNDGDLSMLHATDEELTRFVTKIAPALQRAGYDIRDVLLSRENWDAAVDAVSDYNASMDSASGKSAAVGDALAELAGQMETNVTQAEALKGAMDSLFGVELSQAEALDAWRSGLKDLRDQIAETNGALRGNSDAALDNREAIRSSVEDLQARIAADAAAGVSGNKLAARLLEGRDAIVAQAEAAGASRPEVEAYLDTLGMTPENLATIITTPGLLEAKDQVKALTRLYGLTPKDVRTLIEQANMDDSQENIRRLARLYDLTPRQVRTLITADTGQAESAVWNLTAAINAVPTSRLIQFRVSTTGQVPATYTGAQTYRAAGGEIPGWSPHKRADNIPIMATAGEYMHQVEAVDYYGLGVMDALNQRRIPRAALQGYADGGPIGGRPRYAAGGTIEQRIDILRLQQQINELRKDLNATGKDSIKGLNRQIAALELRQAQADLRAARRAPQREAREAARERRQGLLAANAGFDIEAGMTRPEVRSDIADFRREIREAGGEWTRRMRRQAGVLIEVTGRYQQQARLLEKQEQALEDSRQALDDLRSEAASYGQAVASTFDNNVFGEGLAGLEVRLEADTNDLAASIAAWEQAAGKGLDGPLAEALYASGDVATAQQLAGLSAGQIDVYERLYAARAEKQAQASAFAQQQVMAPQLRQAEEAVRDNAALVRDTRDVMKNLSNRMENLEQRLENGVARGAAQGVKDGMTGRSRQQGAKARARG